MVLFSQSNSHSYSSLRLRASAVILLFTLSPPPGLQYLCGQKQKHQRGGHKKHHMPRINHALAEIDVAGVNALVGDVAPERAERGGLLLQGVGRDGQQE